MTNTERLQADVEASEKYGDGSIMIYVGQFTGNGPSVLSALRRRGYEVTRTAHGAYRIKRIKNDTIVSIQLTTNRKMMSDLPALTEAQRAESEARAREILERHGFHANAKEN